MEGFTTKYNSRALLALSRHQLTELVGQEQASDLCSTLLSKYEECRSVSDLIYFIKVLHLMLKAKPELHAEAAFVKLMGKFVYDRVTRPVTLFSKDPALKYLNDTLLEKSPGNLKSLCPNAEHYHQEA